jgi:sulfotransferase
MIEKQFYFLAGLPRSGSTVLASILNQNPTIYTTPTSPLLDLLYLNEMEWRKCPSVLANPFPEQLVNMSEAIINGTWKHVPQNIIIDKHRAWGRNLPAIEHIFHQKPKVIITVRDIPSIIASFMSLLRRSKQTPHYIDKILIEQRRFINDVNRCDVLWTHFIQDTWDSFKTGWSIDKTSLLLIDYDQFVETPSAHMQNIYDFLELPNFVHDFNNIESQSTDDDLVAWGLEDLHKINSTLIKTAKPAKEVLGDMIYNKYSSMNLEFWK